MEKKIYIRLFVRKSDRVPATEWYLYTNSENMINGFVKGQYVEWNIVHFLKRHPRGKVDFICR